MKIKSYLSLIFCLFVILNSKMYSQSNGCTEPFISEIVYAKDLISITGLSPIDNSYAIEIFNPKVTVLDLNGYSIKLFSTNGSFVSINLSGLIQPKGKFIVSFSGSDMPLTAISDLLSSDLNFQEKSRIEFWGANGILDRIGQINLTQADVINLAAAIADPINYLNSLNLDLTSFKNLTARRKYSESSGDPNFTSPANKWELAQNGDINDLGIFNNVCSDAQTVYYTIQAVVWTSANTYIPLTGQEFYVNQGDVLGFIINTSANNLQYGLFQYGMDVHYDYPMYPCINLASGTYSNCNSSTITWDPIIVNNNQTPYSNFSQNSSGSSFSVDFDNVNYLSPITIKYTVTGGANTSPETAYVIRFDNPPNGTIPNNQQCFAYHIGGLVTKLDENKEEEITTYPNPIGDKINLKFNNNVIIKKYSIFNSIGEEIVNESKYQDYINVSNLSKGIYLLTITTDKSLVKKTIIIN